MSISGEINRIRSNISASYGAVSDAGGSVPATQNSENLPAAIASIGKRQEIEYVVSDAIENRTSVTVVEDTGASTSASDNSGYFTSEYLVVNGGTSTTPYKLNTAAMISLLKKKMVGAGWVRWNGWPSGGYASYNTTMHKGALKVRYSDDPIYMSMKLPSEARIQGTDSEGAVMDFVTHPGMKPTNDKQAANNYIYINSLGAIMPVDYTKLPDEVVVCIGRLAVYTLSKEPNARWELFDYVDRPLSNAAMYRLPWSDCDNTFVKIDSSKVQEFDGYTRYTLTKSDFGPDSGHALCQAKTLHFWGNANKKIDIDNTLAVIELFEVWTETEAAAPYLYTAAGVDRKSATGKISQAFWGRNVLLSTEKTVIAGHNISDALYDEIRDTGRDPRRVYDDYCYGINASKMILTSPDGTRFRISVSNTGTLSATAL